MLPHAQKAWMTERDRLGSVYMNGVASFIAFAKEKNEGLSTCPCPCNLCQNEKRGTFASVERHLITNGMDLSYTKWVFHGENVVEQLEVQRVGEENAFHEGVGNFVDVSYGLHEAGPSNIHEGGDTEMGALGEPNVPIPDLPKKYKEYKTKAEEKLYPSCEGPETTLSVIIELQNMKKQFGWSGASVTVLLSRLRRWFPKGNNLPEKYPTMKEILKDLGMKDKRIDVCENNCILYWKDNEFATECPQCKSPRYKEKVGKKGKNEHKEAKKVLRHFPLIPRLKRLYTIPWIAHEMTWHHRATRSPDYMRHPVDSEQWRIFKLRWPEFASQKRNVWLAIATDGFNPRGVQSSSYSCWPVIVVTYNLPPSMCMKSEFQMMSLLIPGPKAPGQDIDVFLEPLVDELIYLWDVGELAFDMSTKQPFTLKAMLMWGIHDFPAYGNLSGCVTHGYKACPVCGDRTPSIRLASAKKIVYVDFCMFLSMDHPFRSGKYLGHKRVETRTPPQRLNGQEILQKLTFVNYIPGKIQKGSKRVRVDVNEIDHGEEDDDMITDAWYKQSILFKLPYWPHHDVRHVIDVMHVEKNVAEHIINTILDKSHKSKDLGGEREDMKKMGIQSGQWMHGSFVLNKEEKKQFMQILKDLKLPIDFSSNLSNIVALDPPRLQPTKSHDYHVILQYLLPVLLQHAFPKHPDLRRALHQISFFFYILCSKVLDRQAMLAANNMVVEALVVLQKYFPPSFFDISIHLMVHLAEEALICGPVPERWMYPFERAMKECKNIPSNKRYVEGSIAESYLVSESILYAMEYMPNPRDGNHDSSREAFLDEDSEYSDEGPLLNNNKIILDENQFIQIRRWVLFRLDVEGRDEYYSEYRQSLQDDIRGKRKEKPKSEVEIQTDFIVWLYKKLLDVGDTSSMLWRLVEGPMFRAKTYKKYRANGFIFSTKRHDDKVNTQNSGVCMKAITTFQSSRKDKNPVDAWIMYYGVIREIIEVDYMDFTTVVFYCDWAKVEDKTNGCKICPDSNLVMVNLNRLKSTGRDVDEPAILSSEASQVFYSKDLKHPDWWVVIHSPRRLTREVDSIEKPSSFQDILEDQPHLKPLLESHH